MTKKVSEEEAMVSLIKSEMLKVLDSIEIKDLLYCNFEIRWKSGNSSSYLVEKRVGKQVVGSNPTEVFDYSWW